MTISTYNQILELANKYLQKVGFNAFSYSDLANEIGIKKASIHYHFPSKTDLGIAYCHFKLNQLLELETRINSHASIEAKLFEYRNFFIQCAEKKEMCGIHSMLTETDSFSETLQSAVFQLVESELRIIEHIFKNDLDENISMITKVSNYELALMVNSTIKGALLMNRLSKKNIYEHSLNALIQLILSK